MGDIGMPRPGSQWTTVTIDKKALEKIKHVMNESNEEAGYRKFRSISQFMEHAALNYEEGSDINGGWRRHYDYAEVDLEKERARHLEKLRKAKSARQNKRQTRRKS
jgi:hypothetical protein